MTTTAKPVGPRTKIDGRDMKVGDLVLFTRDDGHDCLALITGASKLGARWHLHIIPPPGRRESTVWLPQHIELRRVRQWWRSSKRK